MSQRQKRSLSADVDHDHLVNVKAIILDIEGTTTPITFVKDVLFPYIREHLEKYIKTNWNEKDVKEDVDALRKQAKADHDIDGAVPIPDSFDPSCQKEVISVQDAVIKNVLWLMDADRKITALKQLQGHMWRSGYENGVLKGQVYDDVVPAIKHWILSGRKVYIYSSGSVEAQKLLFGYSEKGDLLELFSGFFDTVIGAKIEEDSYRRIAKEIDYKENEILFVTDVAREARPCRKAGLKTIIVVRPGNAELTEDEINEFLTIHSFQELVSSEDEVKKLKAE
ncbi:enolase-phosphatase E1-like [Saccoglossus kowalevskii]|uniref:Enolase-phosphatase E1 n=1 Tax=Saccoglossus kowalevskii TaxID=10224 RepID=A0ABM0H0B4_SACKO|nr:PREDICTED: enolase-phosphatase E1-like [Saccoglossus kowalevskii]